MNPIIKHEALLRAIDNLIEDHAKDNPKLLKDLQRHRADVEDAARTGRWLDLAITALRISTLIKFIFDHIPPPH